MVIYVCALQRAAHQATTIHLKRLNALVRWLQRNPVAMVYGPMHGVSKCVGISDSGFKKVSDESCHAMRGCVIVLMDGEEDTLTTGTCHIIEVECKKHRVVTRASFSSELHGGTATADLLQMIGLAVHEVECGPVGARRAKEIRDGLDSRLTVALHLVLDALSVIAATVAEQPKAPSEKSLLGHIR